MEKRKLNNILDSNFDENDNKSLKICEEENGKNEVCTKAKVLGEMIKEENGKELYQAFEINGNDYEVVKTLLQNQLCSQ